MLFLALPPADMLPPAGHRARPGRSHGPHRPLRTARRAPRTLSRALVQQQARPRLPYKVAPTPPPRRLPRPALSSRPLGGGPGPGGWAGTRPESQCGQNPGLESSGRRGPRVPLSRPKNPNNSIYPTAMSKLHIQLGVPGAPYPATGAVVHVYMHTHQG